MGIRPHSCAFFFAIVTCSIFIGCGNQGSITTPLKPPESFTIGGTVTGLSGSGLVLADNGVTNLSIPAGATSFTFPYGFASDTAYNITVLTEPSSPAQSCAVNNGSGSVTTSNVTSVQIACTLNATPSPGTYTIGGTVSGLSGSGLVLQDNGGDNLAVNANGTFTFAIPIPSAGSYLVTVLAAPSNPAQSCAVSNSFGYVTSSSVTNVQVACTAPGSSPDAQFYTVGGTVSGLSGTGLVLQDNGGDNLALSTNAAFTFATPLGAGSNFLVTVLNQPSHPAQSCAVSNASGSVIFSGATNVDVTCTTLPASPPSFLTAAGEWTWVSGANVAEQAGVYGQLGVPAAGNIPGARDGAVGWIDAQGNLWLFGGEGPSLGGGCAIMHALCWGGASQYLNDLWKFDGSQWTWMGGSSSPNQQSVYGTLGQAAESNAPGSRYGAVSWKDAQGNFWLFGGIGFDSTGNVSWLNDLWKYAGGQWTWMGGSKLAKQPGVYGVQGTPAAGNFPGARTGAIAFADPSGDVWLFGGDGIDSQGSDEVLNDVWKYSGGQWTWISGEDVSFPAQPGVYGALGTPAPGNVPGARYSAAGWMDHSGNLWIFGGIGYNLLDFNWGGLNDLMSFSGGEWTWMSGSDNLFDQPGTYGTEGTPAPGNTPGSRDSSESWTDAKGNLWLFSGYDIIDGQINDLWKYSAGNWTWVGGSNSGMQSVGTYGTLGVPAPANIPGSRGGAVTWTDAKGNLWLFGGAGQNDLWVYQPQ